jgi:hypothetical protein
MRSARPRAVRRATRCPCPPQPTQGRASATHRLGGLHAELIEHLLRRRAAGQLVQRARGGGAGACGRARGSAMG